MLLYAKDERTQTEVVRILLKELQFTEVFAMDLPHGRSLITVTDLQKARDWSKDLHKQYDEGKIDNTVYADMCDSLSNSTASVMVFDGKSLWSEGWQSLYPPPASSSGSFVADTRSDWQRQRDAERNRYNEELGAAQAADRRLGVGGGMYGELHRKMAMGQALFVDPVVRTVQFGHDVSFGLFDSDRPLLNPYVKRFVNREIGLTKAVGGIMLDGAATVGVVQLPVQSARALIGAARSRAALATGTRSLAQYSNTAHNAANYEQLIASYARIELSAARCVNPAQEANALAQLRHIEATHGAPNVHGLKRHGAGTTIEQQWERASTGLCPGEMGPPAHLSGANLQQRVVQGLPVGDEASRFISFADELEAVEILLKEQARSGLQRVTIDMRRVVGEGYTAALPIPNGHPRYVITTHVQGTFDKNGKLVSHFPLIRELP